MKRKALVGIVAGAAIVGAGLVATTQATPSLPDVQVPAVQLSNSEGLDQTALWLDLFSQASGNQVPGGNAESLGVNPLGPGPVVVIDPQDTGQDFEGILDGVAGKFGNPMDAVTSAIRGPDAATYLIRNGGS